MATQPKSDIDDAKHAMVAFKKTIEPFMGNLKTIVPKMLSFFRVLDFVQEITISAQDLADYELYLRMIHFSPDVVKKVQPTMAVQLLWMVHALKPTQYHADCQKAFGETIPVELNDLQPNGFTANSEDLRKSLAQCVRVVDETVYSGGFVAAEFDLKDAAQRQYKFVTIMNEIQKSSRPIDDAQIALCIDRYYKFLFLSKTQNDLNKQLRRAASFQLVPMHDIDLLWHCHQMDVLNYHKMSRVVGSVDVMSHDDTIVGDTLNKYAAKTEPLWDAKFGQGDYKKRVFAMTFAVEKRINSRKRKHEEMDSGDSSDESSSSSKPKKRKKVESSSDEESSSSGSDDSDESSAEVVDEKFDFESETDCNVLIKRLKTEIKQRKALAQKVEQLKRRNNSLTSTISDLEEKMGECTCGACQTCCGGCG